MPDPLDVAVNTDKAEEDAMLNGIVNKALRKRKPKTTEEEYDKLAAFSKHAAPELGPNGEAFGAGLPPKPWRPDNATKGIGGALNAGLEAALKHPANPAHRLSDIGMGAWNVAHSDNTDHTRGRVGARRVAGGLVPGQQNGPLGDALMNLATEWSHRGWGSEPQGKPPQQPAQPAPAGPWQDSSKPYTSDAAISEFNQHMKSLEPERMKAWQEEVRRRMAPKQPMRGVLGPEKEGYDKLAEYKQAAGLGGMMGGALGKPQMQAPSGMMGGPKPAPAPAAQPPRTPHAALGAIAGPMMGSFLGAQGSKGAGPSGPPAAGFRDSAPHGQAGNPAFRSAAPHGGAEPTFRDAAPHGGPAQAGAGSKSLAPQGPPGPQPPADPSWAGVGQATGPPGPQPAQPPQPAGPSMADAYSAQSEAAQPQPTGPSMADAYSAQSEAAQPPPPSMLDNMEYQTPPAPSMLDSMDLPKQGSYDKLARMDPNISNALLGGGLGAAAGLGSAAFSEEDEDGKKPWLRNALMGGLGGAGLAAGGGALAHHLGGGEGDQESLLDMLQGLGASDPPGIDPSDLDLYADNRSWPQDDPTADPADSDPFGSDAPATSPAPAPVPTPTRTPPPGPAPVPTPTRTPPTDPTMGPGTGGGGFGFGGGGFDAAGLPKQGYDKLAMMVPTVKKVMNNNQYGKDTGFDPGVRTDSDNGWGDSPAQLSDKEAGWQGINKQALSTVSDSVNAALANVGSEAALGGALGMGAGALYGSLAPGKDENGEKRSQLRQAIKYALMGGGAGGATGAGLKALASIPGLSKSAAPYGSAGITGYGRSPVGEREPLSEQDEEMKEKGEKRWFPRIFSSMNDTPDKMMANPAKYALLTALLGGGIGAGLGGVYGGMAGGMSNDFGGIGDAGMGAGIGAGLGGLLGAGVGGVGGYFGRQAANEDVIDQMHRHGDGVTRRDILSDPLAGGGGGPGNPWQGGQGGGGGATNALLLANLMRR